MFFIVFRFIKKLYSGISYLNNKIMNERGLREIFVLLVCIILGFGIPSFVLWALVGVLESSFDVFCGQQTSKELYVGFSFMIGLILTIINDLTLPENKEDLFKFEHFLNYFVLDHANTSKSVYLESELIDEYLRVYQLEPVPEFLEYFRNATVQYNSFGEYEKTEVDISYCMSTEDQVFDCWELNFDRELNITLLVK
jgi:hypothetical protein